MTICPFGDYTYEMGYCLRDALRQYFGPLPILDQFPIAATIDWMRALADLHGWPYVLPGPEPARTVQWSFTVGEPIIWSIADDAWGDNLTNRNLHAVYATDPRIILRACKRYGWHITGWIEIGKGQPLCRVP